MGRLKIDAYGTAHFKRRISPSHTKLNGQSQFPKSSLGRGGGSRNQSRSRSAGRDRAGASGSTQKLTRSHARSYVKEVKDTFLNQMEKYHMFIDVMKDINNQRIDVGGVIARVKDLFKGYPNLILGFNTFLPNGYEITFNDDEEASLTKSVEFEQAVSLVNKIKKRFRNADYVYKSFINILGKFRKENKDIKEVYDEIAVLLNGHPDLLDELNKFFPDPVTVNPFHLKRSPLCSIIGPHAEIDRNMLHHTDEKKSVQIVKEFGGPHEDESKEERKEKKCKTEVPHKEAISFLKKIKERFQNVDHAYKSFTNIIKTYKEPRSIYEVYHEVAKLLNDHPDLLAEFTKFLQDP
ncbi:paired amphipathic helix protein Sin3-like 1 isoform X2 [Lycium barbarum]|uniref:paired amphipathic helix protein Sin3-like 1 isoform X2 n=1 Tax=Lycium barbarum TaxID=112863 RepID=UPI00293F74B4|nr:paired amphipathic helix protein Sin3-like 1 isoform X2 [Lycium barbarum]